MSQNRRYKLCRLCLCDGEHLINVFEGRNELEIRLEKDLEDLLNVKVVKETGCPWFVCSTCLEKLTEFRLFKRRCVECLFVFYHRVQKGYFPGAGHSQSNGEKKKYKEKGEYSDGPIDDGKESADTEEDNSNINEILAKAWGNGSPMEVDVDLGLTPIAGMKTPSPGGTGMDPLTSTTLERTVTQCLTEVMGEDSDNCKASTDIIGSPVDAGVDKGIVGGKADDASGNCDEVGNITISLATTVAGSKGLSSKGTKKDDSHSLKNKDLGTWQIPMEMVEVCFGDQEEVAGNRSGRKDYLKIVGKKVDVHRGDVTETPGEEEMLAIMEEKCSGDEPKDGKLGEDTSLIQGLKTPNFQGMQSRLCSLSRKKESSIEHQNNETAVCRIASMAREDFRNKAQHNDADADGLTDIHPVWITSSKSIKQKSCRLFKKNAQSLEQVLKCDQCGYECNTKAHMGKHINVHLKGDFFNCRICLKSFSTRDEFEMHKSNHQGVITVENEENSACNTNHINKRNTEACTPTVFLKNFEISPPTSSIGVVDVMASEKGQNYSNAKASGEYKVSQECENTVLHSGTFNSSSHKEDSEEEERNTLSSGKKCISSQEMCKKLIISSCQRNEQDDCRKELINSKFKQYRKRYKHIDHEEDLVQVHSKETPYSCNICSEFFTNESDLRGHMGVHMVQGTHSRVRRSTFPHELSLKNPNTQYACTMCPKTFSRRAHLNSHIRTHTGAKPFSCEVCSKEFSDKTNLKRHARIHTGDKPHRCDVCSKSFSDNGTLKRHIRIHTGDKPYACDMCSKAFSRKGNLDAHIRTHSGENPFSCDVCSKSFHDEGTLRRHIRIHTGDKPHSCHVCSKAFSDKGALKRHTRIHTGDKPHSCHVCSKSFIVKSTLKRHIKIHTGDKQYVCDMCSKAFIQKSNLIFHIRRHIRDK